MRGNRYNYPVFIREYTVTEMGTNYALHRNNQTTCVRNILSICVLPHLHRVLGNP